MQRIAFNALLIIVVLCAAVQMHAGLLHGLDLTGTRSHVAVSHQSFTSLHQAVPIHTPTLLPHYGTYRASSLLGPVPPSPASHYPLLQRSTAPVVKPLTHTPAHLTYAAAPIVYQMLPSIKPARAIAF